MNDYELMQEAIEESRKSNDEDSRNHPRVGALIVKDGEIIARAHRGEIPGSHAEYVALRKVEDVSLESAVVYTTLEPCTCRNHPKISCAERLVRAKVGHVVIGMLDPNPIISGQGLRFLRRSGVKVTLFPDELMKEVEEINKEFDSQFELMALASQKQTLGAFQANLNSIYADVNTDKSVEYIYSYLHRSVDFLMSSISKHKQEIDKGNIVVEFIRSFSWLFTLGTKVGCNMQEAFFMRFPKTCPYCLEESCICHITSKTPKPRLSLSTRQRIILSPLGIQHELQQKYEAMVGRDVFGFDFAIQTMASLYPMNKVIWHKAGALPHMIKIVEELGEVHEAISKFLRDEAPAGNRLISEELSDVLAWLLSAWDLVFPGLSLDTETFNYYSSGCPVCKSTPCTCEIYSGRSVNLIELSLINSVSTLLHELSEITGNKIVEKLHTAVNEAEHLQSDSLVRLCLLEVAYQLNLIENATKSSNQFYKEILSISHKIQRLISPVIQKHSEAYYQTV